MKTIHNSSTKEEIIEKGTNAKDGRIAPLDLAMQIYPLLDDYFCGIFEKNTKGVLMKINGQIFQLKVEEVA